MTDMSAEHWPGDAGDLLPSLWPCPGCYAEWCLEAVCNALLIPDVSVGIDLHAPEWRTAYCHPVVAA